MNSKALILILNTKTGKILLQDRRQISKFWEQWGTFGGGIEKWETPLEWAIRELEEELDLQASEKMIFLEKVSFMIWEKKQDRYFFLDFTTQDKFIDYEGDGAVYFSISEIKKLHFWSYEGFNIKFFRILDKIKIKYINN